MNRKNHKKNKRERKEKKDPTPAKELEISTHIKEYLVLYTIRFTFSEAQGPWDCTSFVESANREKLCI